MGKCIANRSSYFVRSGDSFGTQVIAYIITNIPTRQRLQRNSRKVFLLPKTLAVANVNYKQPASTKVEKGLGFVRNQPAKEYLAWQNPKMPYNKRVEPKQEVAMDSIKKKDVIVD